MFLVGLKLVIRVEILIFSLQDIIVRMKFKFLGVDSVFQVQFNVGVVVFFLLEIVLDGNKREDKGIFIEFDYFIFVYGYFGDECCEGEGFLVIFVDFWGMEYDIVIYINSIVVVVVVEDNMEVIVKGFWVGVFFEFNYYVNGDNIMFIFLVG